MVRNTGMQITMYPELSGYALYQYGYSIRNAGGKTMARFSKKFSCRESWSGGAARIIDLESIAKFFRFTYNVDIKIRRYRLCIHP